MAAYAAALLALCAQWWLFKADVGIGYPNAVATAVKCCGDCCLVLLPYFLLPRRWRWSVVLPVWGYGIWCVANVAYFRFWHDLIPPAAVTMGSNINSDLAGYALALVVPADWWFVVIPAIVTAGVIIIKPSGEPGLAGAARLASASVSLLVFLLGQASYFVSHRSWLRDDFGVTSLSGALRDHFLGDRVSSMARYSIDGMVMHFVHFPVDAAAQLSGTVTLDDGEKEEIVRFVSGYALPRGGEGRPDIDSMNVVYVIVESLNAGVMDRTVNGLRIAATMDSLAALDGTVLMDNVVSQVKHSNSSDGHLLLLTGLLPPRDMAFCFRFGAVNRFHSLAEAMPGHFKHVYLADNGQFWNEKNVLGNFGLGPVTTNCDTPAGEARDERMFRTVAEAIDSMPKPFFLTLVTMSMHIPFKEDGWEQPTQISTAEGLTDNEKNYLTVTHYFDKCLGEFVKCLPDNTILIVASDHSVSLTGDDEYPPAMFMAVNVGLTERVSRTVGQVNLFPATLELLNLHIDGYGGMAPSALIPCVDGTMDSGGRIYGAPSAAALDTLRTAYRLSDLIIRSDAFAP